MPEQECAITVVIIWVKMHDIWGFWPTVHNNSSCQFYFFSGHFSKLITINYWQLLLRFWQPVCAYWKLSVFIWWLLITFFAINHFKSVLQLWQHQLVIIIIYITEEWKSLNIFMKVNTCKIKTLSQIYDTFLIFSLCIINL